MANSPPIRPGIKPPPSPAQCRVVAAFVFVPTLGVLVLAALLDPNPKGHGTHTNLGLPPCGMLAAFHTPCPSCGMTTSFAYAAEGRLIKSFVNQPAGAVLAVATAMTTIISGWALLVGMPLTPAVELFGRPRTVWIGAAVLILAWFYKILCEYGVF